MGALFDLKTIIEQTIKERHLPAFETRGNIALRAGFVLTTIKQDSPDDLKRIQSLRRAAEEVLGVKV